MTWTAPTGGAARDWIGLFRVGDANTAYLAYRYTGGASSGSVAFTAPSSGGLYEFRYLLNGGYIDGARSPRITVN